MQIKRYETATLAEAKRRIRRDLGPDAIILSTKRIADHPPRIEVMAARDEKEGPAPASGGERIDPEQRRAELFSFLRDEVRALKSSVAELAGRLIEPVAPPLTAEAGAGGPDGLPAMRKGVLGDLYRLMVENGVSDARARALVETLRQSDPGGGIDTYEKGAAAARRLIAGTLPGQRTGEGRITALIGPCGVGKTTTLAKLAAHYSIERKLAVGMITTDTYRIAAVEQLKVYAATIGLPLRVAARRDALARSVSDFSDKEVILVDTPGQGRREERATGELAGMLGQEIECVLLLSPTASREHLLDTAERFGRFRYQRIILTKIDECRRLGSLYDTLGEIGKPVSHMTTGQNVPWDIERASPEGLARMILNQRLH